MIKHVLLAALCAASVAYAGTDASGLLQAIKAKTDKVSTYKAVVGITVDVPFMKVPPAEATLYYKAPDKTAFEAKGFAMLPKQGADVTALRLLQRPHVAIDAGTGTYKDATLRKVKVLPSDDASDVVVATLWIHEGTLQIRKVESTMKKGGTVVAELTYANESSARFGMPSYVTLTLDVGSFEIPKTMTGDFDAPKRDKTKGPQQAVVKLTYKSVEFNKPVPESVFK